MVPICFGPPQKEKNSIKIVTSCITMSLCLLVLRRPSHSRKQRKEGSHLNPSPLRRPFRSTRTFRDEWLISEANLASNKQSLLFSGEGDISSCYPLVISLSLSAKKKKKIIFRMFWCLWIDLFMVGGAIIDVLRSVRKKENTHTHSERERQEGWKVLDLFFMSRKQMLPVAENMQIIW